MAKNSRGKRPCSICRKWFQPDVRQKGRQKTCSPACRKELHRRQCENLNRKNKADYKNNYLTKKLEKAEIEFTSNSASAVISLQRQTKPVLPMDVIVAEYGIKPAVIIQYLASQIITHGRIYKSP
ncbi:hypothetical protein HRM2_48850 [Desulforapulum autotrophicum HRM2]|uniref:Uncharacterized protein n=1 Tax=Desulforapulum autotrophicum (strain ATCC 43914 / DSM 3382 / VKM B-1955 / HRM2) TaxID=177437 RepID=C0QII9_DESAH|nr:hypothetical protein [Desulforapulum autotrophicum]ACN17933.1 hypothetical protein HRM2_48850 [Desulforapulum autotrophicum HRM2]